MQQQTDQGGEASGVISSEFACLRCGYSLQGLAVSAMCPECGQPAATSLPAVVAELTVGGAGAIVDSDRPCAGCGYNLRGLSVEGACPECGTAVRLSLRGSLLRYGSPAHLAVLHRGALLVEVAILVLVVGAALMILIAAVANSSMFGLLPGPAVELVWGGLWAATSIMGLVGWWLISTPDPGMPPDAPGGRSRRVLRIGVAVQLVGALLSLAFESVMAAVSPSSAAPMVLLMVGGALSIVTIAAWAVSFFAAMAYVGHLAKRVPDAELASRAKTMTTLGWVVVGGWATLIGLLAAVALLGGAVPLLGPALGVGACFALPVLGVVSFIALILYIVLMDRLRVDLRRERAASELERASEGEGRAVAR